MTADPRKYYVRDRPGQHHNYHLVNWRDRADITSFYFTRFPEDATEEELWFQFKQMGDVREIFIPKLRNKEGRKYGFVRFKGVSDAKRMERKLDNIIVGGLKLHVNIPKYGRGKARQEQYVAKHVRQMEGENGKGRVATPPNVRRTYAVCQVLRGVIISIYVCRCYVNNADFVRKGAILVIFGLL